MNLADEFLKYSHLVDQRANQLTKDMLIELNKAHATITGKLATLEAEALKKPFNQSTHAQRKKVLNRQKQSIEAVIKDVFKEINVLIEEAADDTLFSTSQHTHKTFTTLNINAPVFNKLTLPVTKKWFEAATVDGMLINEMINRLETSTTDKIVSAARQSLIQGKGAAALARDIKKMGIEGSHRGFEGLARTLLSSANNYAREELVNENYAEALEAWQYVGTLDRSTCLVCGGDDGKIFKGANKPILPRHLNCRCVYIPLIKDQEKTGSRPYVKESFERYINHRDGSRSKKYNPTDIGRFKGNYNAWLKEQLKTDPGFVKSILGPKRYELFSKGKITLNMMTTDGKVKKLSEL
jgi:SPP1 gp7 family putative phage head morphogenesis protein